MNCSQIPCRYFARGMCRFPRRCRFSHQNIKQTGSALTYPRRKFEHHLLAEIERTQSSIRRNRNYLVDSLMRSMKKIDDCNYHCLRNYIPIPGFGPIRFFKDDLTQSEIRRRCSPYKDGQYPKYLVNRVQANLDHIKSIATDRRVAAQVIDELLHVPRLYSIQDAHQVAWTVEDVPTEYSESVLHTPVCGQTRGASWGQSDSSPLQVVSATHMPSAMFEEDAPVYPSNPVHVDDQSAYFGNQCWHSPVFHSPAHRAQYATSPHNTEKSSRKAECLSMWRSPRFLDAPEFVPRENTSARVYSETHAWNIPNKENEGYLTGHDGNEATSYEMNPMQRSSRDDIYTPNLHVHADEQMPGEEDSTLSQPQLMEPMMNLQQVLQHLVAFGLPSFPDIRHRIIYPESSSAWRIYHDEQQHQNAVNSDSFNQYQGNDISENIPATPSSSPVDFTSPADYPSSAYEDTDLH